MGAEQDGCGISSDGTSWCGEAKVRAGNVDLGSAGCWSDMRCTKGDCGGGILGIQGVAGLPREE